MNKKEDTKKQCILFICQLPPPVHGASTMNQAAIKSEQLKASFQIEVINLDFVTSVKQIERFSFKKIFKALFFAWLILAKIWKHQPALVYITYSPRGYAFYRDAFYVFLIKLMRRKIVFHFHGKGIRQTVAGNALAKSIARFVFQNVHVICLSNKLATDLTDVYEGTPFIVPNGVPLLSPGKPELSQKKNSPPIILFLSNFIRDKGILVLIDALTLLKEKGLPFHTRLVGNPGDLSFQEVKDYIKKSGLQSQIELVGPRFGQEKAEEFNRADIFVFPTFYKNEAFPLVNLEAMQFGLPVITTNEGGITDMVIDQKTGLLVESRNPTALAQSIELLLKDEVLRVNIGQNGYERFMSHYTLQHFERNLFSTLSRIIESPVDVKIESIPQTSSKQVIEKEIKG